MNEEEKSNEQPMETVNHRMFNALRKIFPTIQRLKFIEDGSYGKNYVRERAERAQAEYDVVRAAIDEAEEELRGQKALSKEQVRKDERERCIAAIRSVQRKYDAQRGGGPNVPGSVCSDCIGAINRLTLKR